MPTKGNTEDRINRVLSAIERPYAGISAVWGNFHSERASFFRVSVMHACCR